jgi:hypothetical protein
MVGACLQFVISSVVLSILLVAPLQASSRSESIVTMVENASRFLDSLSAEQRAKALFALDSDERFELRLAPLPPWGGVALGEMTTEQSTLVNLLLGASLSSHGYQKAAGIIALEAYLVELERQAGSVPPVHGIGRYTVAIFGEPKLDGTWGWRVQGHHLSLNFLVDRGEVYVLAPAFLGAQPHHVTEGPRAGWHILGDEENLGRALMSSLDPEQRKRATLAAEMPRDMFAGDKRTYDLAELRGLPWSALDAKQRELFAGLVEEYITNVPADVSARRRAAIEKGGWEKIHFGWIGSLEPGERFYYRVQGPEFLIEYCAVALTPNHVHTIWREKHGDFGADVLGEHMRRDHSSN